MHRDSAAVWQRPVFIYIGLISLGVGLIRFYHFVLLDRLTPLGLMALWLVAAGLGLLGLGWVIWAGLGAYRSTSAIARKQPIWLWLGLLTLPLWGVGLPGEKLWLWLNFHRYRADRQQVVQLMQTGEITAHPGIVALPAAFQGTSLGGGDVQVLRPDGSLSVLFFTLRVYEGAAGFLYSTNLAPLPEEAVSGYTLLEQRSLGNGWYYVRLGG